MKPYNRFSDFEHYLLVKAISSELPNASMETIEAILLRVLENYKAQYAEEELDTPDFYTGRGLTTKELRVVNAIIELETAISALKARQSGSGEYNLIPKCPEAKARFKKRFNDETLDR